MIRSARLAIGDEVTTGADSTVFVVPPGAVALIKFLGLQNLSGVADVYGWSVLAPSGSRGPIASQFGIAHLAIVPLQVNIALEEGDELQLFIGAQPWRYLVTGALLGA